MEVQSTGDEPRNVAALSGETGPVFYPQKSYVPRYSLPEGNVPGSTTVLLDGTFRPRLHASDDAVDYS